jgi:integrase
MALTEISLKHAKPRAKPYKLADGGGLYLLVLPAGGKYWRFKYRFAGKEKLLAIGVYPDMRAPEAREERDTARRALKEGRDPATVKQERKRASVLAAGNTFEAVAREWFGKFSPAWAKGHADKIIQRLENDIFPWIGNRPVAELKAPEVLACLRRIEHRRALETAHRAMQNCSRVFRYAVVTGRAERDPCGDLRGALPPTKAKHHASVTDPKAIGALMRAINGYDGSPATKCALRLAALTFVRPGELRKAEWCEVDLDGAEWRIPAERMKMRAPHIVPLSSQAVAILRELQPITGSGRYLFPGARSAKRSMSENTVNAALRRLGYSKDDMTGHGFRSMASTLLNEQGWNRDAIERQLAHAERDEVRAAYNYAEHLPERKRMMQAWAGYLDGLANGAHVTPIKRVA